MNETDAVIVNLATLKISDKLLEIQEHLAYQAELVAELEQLMADWTVL